MSLGFCIVTVAEVLVGLFIIWGFWHEDKVVAFEDKFFSRLGIPRRQRRTAKITRFSTEQQNRERSCI